MELVNLGYFVAVELGLDTLGAAFGYSSEQWHTWEQRFCSAEMEYGMVERNFCISEMEFNN